VAYLQRYLDGSIKTAHRAYIYIFNGTRCFNEIYLQTCIP